MGNNSDMEIFAPVNVLNITKTRLFKYIVH